MVWAQYASFLALTVSCSSLFTPALLRTHSFVFFAVHVDTMSIKRLISAIYDHSNVTLNDAIFNFFYF